MKRFISLFSGGGGADIGAMMAGYTPIVANENDPDIAAVYALNIGDHVRVSDILTQDPHDYPACDLLHASPPCPNFSVAKSGAVETSHDIALAEKIAEFIRILGPAAITIENVSAYRRSESYRIILRAIEEGGYVYDARILNAADMGVPQTRRRLFIRAKRGLLQEMPAPVKWMGWYESIADLIDTLPESKFANWQLKRLPEFLQSHTVDSAGFPDTDGITIPVTRKYDEPINTIVSNYHRREMRAFLVGGANTSDQQAAPGVGVSETKEPTRVVHPRANDWRAFLMPNANSSSASKRNGDEPSLTIGNVERVGNQPRAFISDSLNYSSRNPNRFKDEPAKTITIHSSKHPAPIAWLETGRVVKMTPRALARFQSFPDWYKLPHQVSLACRIIGNAVPPLMYMAVARSLD